MQCEIHLGLRELQCNDFLSHAHCCPCRGALALHCKHTCACVSINTSVHKVPENAQVDVEGDEEEVLMGMTQWEAVSQVVAEVHEVDGRAERLKQLLESHGFLVVADRGSAPRAVMLYAAKEGRLLGEFEEAL